MDRSINRRQFIGAGVATTMIPAVALANTTATRSFRIFRDGSDIGVHRVTVSRDGGAVRARTEIDIAVTVLGFTAYRYVLNYDEVYREGLLETLSSTANDDGDAAYVKAKRTDAGLSVDGSTFQGLAPLSARPTSYWRKDALSSSPWISAQGGELLPVVVTPGATRMKPPAGSSAWHVTDSAGYDVDVWYDAAGDWTGCAFDARGEIGVYRLEPNSTSILEISQ